MAGARRGSCADAQRRAEFTSMATASERNPQRRHPGRRTHLVTSVGSDTVTLGPLYSPQITALATESGIHAEFVEIVPAARERKTGKGMTRGPICL